MTRAKDAYEFAVHWTTRSGVDTGTTGLTEANAILEWSRLHGMWHLGWITNLHVKRRSVGEWEKVDVPIVNGDLRGMTEGVDNVGTT